jgi:tetratricopeptide (TPR) repeat protein
MKTLLTSAAAAALWVAAILPAAAQQQTPAPDVLAQPSFAAVAADFSAAESLELAAHINMVLRQYERAIPMFEVLLKAAPNRPDLWAALAMAYNRAGEPREAHDAANIAVTLAPHLPHFYAERGVAAFFLGRHADSIADLAVYVKAFPHHANAHFYLGLAQAARGEPETARANLLRARRLNPDLSLSVDYYLGLIAAGRGQVAMSRELLARTQEAFAGSDLPVTRLVAEQLQQVDGAVSQRMRAAMHESDARLAALPGAPAGR